MGENGENKSRGTGRGWNEIGGKRARKEERRECGHTQILM